MSKKRKLWVFGLLALVVVAAAAVYLSRTNIPVLQPRGEVGQKERNLMYFSLLLSVLVVVPVFTMLAVFSLKYRDTNPKAKKYQPDWEHGRKLELTWWAIPGAIITVLAVITWNSSHDLDPFKPLNAQAKPLKIQVVALDWKWLFIYPEQNIATVNFLQFPLNTPLDFEITADAPMNSFWIPQLGGQIYAMPGMSTELHLMASKAGDYSGRSANISGKGFSGMTFTARASSSADYNSWLKFVKKSPKTLSLSAYGQLAKPSSNNPTAYYASEDSSIYNSIIDKYAGPGGHAGHVHGADE